MPTAPTDPTDAAARERFADRLAAELFREFERDERAFVQGDPAEGHRTSLDGDWDLRAVVRRAIEAASDYQSNLTSA